MLVNEFLINRDSIEYIQLIVKNIVAAAQSAFDKFDPEYENSYSLGTTIHTHIISRLQKEPELNSNGNTYITKNNRIILQHKNIKIYVYGYSKSKKIYNMTDEIEMSHDLLCSFCDINKEIYSIHIIRKKDNENRLYSIRLVLKNEKNDIIYYEDLFNINDTKMEFIKQDKYIIDGVNVNNEELEIKPTLKKCM